MGVRIDLWGGDFGWGIWGIEGKGTGDASEPAPPDGCHGPTYLHTNAPHRSGSLGGTVKDGLRPQSSRMRRDSLEREFAAMLANLSQDSGGCVLAS